jgi:hypothetical protein
MRTSVVAILGKGRKKRGVTKEDRGRVDEFDLLCEWDTAHISYRYL